MLEHVAPSSGRGYVTYNSINPAEFRSLTPAELCGIAPDARSEPEVPLTHPGNCIITWGPAATLPT